MFTGRFSMCSILLALMFSVVRDARAVDSDLPLLRPKPYQIGITPCHITTPPQPLFDRPTEWSEVLSGIDVYKYYGEQVANIDRVTPLAPKPFVALMKERGIQIGCEFGYFYPNTKEPFQHALDAAVSQIQPIFNAGGEVTSLHLDGPERRLIRGIQTDPNALTLDQIADGLAWFWEKIHEKYPEMRIGLLSNFPNWDYTKEFLGERGGFTDQSGFTYQQVLEKVYSAVIQAGEKIEFVEIDTPYYYYMASMTREGDARLDNAGMFLSLQKWCEDRQIRFHIILNAEPRGTGGKGFHDWTLDYIRDLRRDGIFPDMFIIQSWYPEPATDLPESEPYTFMNTARDAIRLIKELYPKVAVDEKSSCVVGAPDQPAHDNRGSDE